MSKTKFWNRKAGIVAAAMVCMCLGAALPTHARDSFEVQLRWFDQAQFMGYYMAQANGYYEREDLDVTILPGGPGIEPLDSLSNGQADAIVEWLPMALEARQQGLDVVNIAQFFQRSGMMLTCLRSRDIQKPDDLRGKQVSAWEGSLEMPLRAWLSAQEIPATGGEDGVEISPQSGNTDALFDGETDCVSTMQYNEYWELLEKGLTPQQLVVFRFEELGFSLLEDGLYITRDCFNDEACADRAIRFLRGTIKGWQYSIDNPEQAIASVLGMLSERRQLTAEDSRHQSHMAREIIKMLSPNPADIGLLDIAAYQRTVDLLLGHQVDVSLSGHDHRNAWSHELWADAVGEKTTLFDRKTLFYFRLEAQQAWFYYMVLFGSGVFGVAGFLRAQERRYDIWGALVLTSLPAVGGGTLRDIIVGGERLPLSIVTDPAFAYLIGGIVFVGCLFAFVWPPSERFRSRLIPVQTICETAGLAVLTVVGAQVAISAEMSWYWIPICAAITASGGGILMDVCTGQEPRAFQGQPFEELALLAGLLMAGLLHLANYMFDPQDYMVWITVVSLLFVVLSRTWMIKARIRSPRLGMPQ